MSLTSTSTSRPVRPRGALAAQALGLGTTTAVAVLVTTTAAAGTWYVAKAIAVEIAIGALVVRAVRSGHPFDRFGPANLMTSVRAAMVAAAAGLIGEPPSVRVATVAAALAVVVTLLDGVDGWLARRTESTSAFGARFDMEVDALLILVLALLAWTFGKAGPWIVLAGALRYLFVAAGWIWRWIAAPLPPSLRRKTICVLQIVGLAAVVSPVLPLPASAIVAIATLAMLASSFALDTVWLRQHRA